MSSKKNFKIDPDLKIRHDNREYTFKQLVDFYINRFDSINHKVYRRVVKKVERKFKRQTGISNGLIASNDSILIDENSEQNDQEDDATRARLHQLWLQREKIAQIVWKTKKDRETLLSKKPEDDLSKTDETISKQTSSKLTNEQDQDHPTHNPEMDLDQLMLMREPCKFFVWTGVCPNVNMCNRSHMVDYSQTSQSMTTLIFPSMYKYMLQGYELLKLNNESDDILEYDETDIKENFKVFYDEIFNEFRKYGRVVQLLVCSNYQPHLRGNVYVQYEREESAKTAFQELNNWHFRGKRVYCFFTHVNNWQKAICRDFLRNKCKNGQKCNYLHIFENPYSEFSSFGLQRLDESRLQKNTNRSERNEIYKNQNFSNQSAELVKCNKDDRSGKLSQNLTKRQKK